MISTSTLPWWQRLCRRRGDLFTGRRTAREYVSSRRDRVNCRNRRCAMRRINSCCCHRLSSPSPISSTGHSRASICRFCQSSLATSAPAHRRAAAARSRGCAPSWSGRSSTRCCAARTGRRHCRANVDRDRGRRGASGARRAEAERRQSGGEDFLKQTRVEMLASFVNPFPTVSMIIGLPGRLSVDPRLRTSFSGFSVHREAVIFTCDRVFFPHPTTESTAIGE